MKSILFILFACFSYCLIGHTYGYSEKKILKYSEDLDRGVVVINSKSKEAFISWRFLITDDDYISFNLYREEISEEGAIINVVKLNSEPISKVTYFRDSTRDIKKEYNYFVGSIISSQEVENSTKYNLKANTPVIPCYHVPLRAGCKIRTVWPGDLNGDGKFDFVIDRSCDLNQKVEAYLSNGTFLWQIDLGHNSINHDNIKPGPTTINVGHWDGVNVYDLDGDGKAEVYLRIANNVTLGDGYVFLNTGHPPDYPYIDSDQWIACIDGMTGKLKQKTRIPDDFVEHGGMALQLGVGYPNGLKPSLIGVMKNRDKKNNFHMIIATYIFDENGNFILDWYWKREDGYNCHDGHHFRIADVDMDGIDEILEIGFALNGNGTLRYAMGYEDVGHGDRFYTGRYNKDDDTMMGYGVQQLNPTNLTEYYYNASSGKVIWRHILDKCIDNGRGNIGDFDPRTPGLEVYSYFGMYNAKTNEVVANDTSSLWPSNNIFWDGSLVTACYHKNIVNKWNAEKGYADRLLTAYSVYYKVYNKYFVGDNTYPLFHGDIIGDWREEFIVATPDYDGLVIFTTDYDTEYRITTLSQDPGMRSSMTLNGYKQSHMSLMYMATDMDIDKERQYIKKYMKARALKGGSFCDSGYGLEKKDDGDYTGECIKCPPNCASCYEDASICNECSNGFGLNNERKTKDSEQCIPCEDVNCGECGMNSSTCLKCKPGFVFILENGVQTDQCGSCPSNCLSCDQETSLCIECAPGFSFDDDDCLPCLDSNCGSCKNDRYQCDTCKNGFCFDDDIDSLSFGECVKCPVKIDCTVEKCDKCIDGSLEKCELCTTGWIVDDNFKCVIDNKEENSSEKDESNDAVISNTIVSDTDEINNDELTETTSYEKVEESFEKSNKIPTESINDEYNQETTKEIDRETVKVEPSTKYTQMIDVSKNAINHESNEYDDNDKNNTAHNGNKLSKSAVIGIVVACCVAVIIIATVVILVVKKLKRKASSSIEIEINNSEI